MLVKLGDVWVDPVKVVIIDHSDSVISIITETKSVSSSGNADNFASIVNNAIGQSYGDENEENLADA